MPKLKSRKLWVAVGAVAVIIILIQVLGGDNQLFNVLISAHGLIMVFFLIMVVYDDTSGEAMSLAETVVVTEDGCETLTGGGEHKVYVA